MLAESYLPNPIQNNFSLFLDANSSSTSISIHKAVSDEMVGVCKRIRFEVYCQQLHFENPESFPNHKEEDDFDAISQHFLIKNEKTNKYIATLRFVIPRFNAFGLIPLERHYQGHYMDSKFNPVNLATGSYMEVSRLAILRETGSRRKFSADVARVLYLLSLAFFNANEHLQSAFCFMDKRLARRLNMVGIPFIQIGSEVDFKGARAPFCVFKHSTSHNVSSCSRALYSSIRAQSHILKAC